MNKLKARIIAIKAKYGTLWQIMYGFVALWMITIVGIIGYMWIEGWGFLDSFYMIVITLSSVGYMEVQPLSDAGRIWTSILILGGVGSFLFLAGAFSQTLIEGRLQRFWGRLRVQKTINKLDEHFIVCGYGRIGSIVVREILNEGHSVVVIEQDHELITRMEDEGILCLKGDATKDETLLEANLEKAKALITALSDEAANVYVTLTVRQLNPDIQIIARADETPHIQRLELAGANKVVMPNVIGGVRMAQNVLRPTVTNFLELAMRGNIDLQMEEVMVSAQSEFSGKDLIASEIRPRFNVMVVAIKKYTGDMIFNPAASEVMEGGDTLLVVGRTSDLEKLEEVL